MGISQILGEAELLGVREGAVKTPPAGMALVGLLNKKSPKNLSGK